MGVAMHNQTLLQQLPSQKGWKIPSPNSTFSVKDTKDFLDLLYIFSVLTNNHD
jgi:hypothetical protein